MNFPPGVSLVQFIAHLKTLDFDVSLIQLQASSYRDGASKARTPLGPLMCLASPAKTTSLSYYTDIRELTCSCNKSCS